MMKRYIINEDKMRSETIILPAMTIIGITQRIHQSSDCPPISEQIGEVVDRYWQEGIAQQISGKKQPGTTYCGYTDYESDYTGDYTYFIGECVEDDVSANTNLSKVIIPKQRYTKFTTDAGVMPEICINAWQQIWSMSSKELSGSRAYICDFELYDQRAKDPKDTVLDIYIGISH